MAIVFPNNTISEVSSSFITYPGNIVQMVESRITATVTCNNWATPNNLGTLTITPTSASNRILLYINMNMRQDTTQGSWSLCYLDLHNATRGQLIISGWEGTWRHTIYSYRKQYLDSPNSTSPQTYTLRGYNYPSGAVAYFNTATSSDGFCYIRATEIAA